MKMPFLLIRPKIVLKNLLIKKGGCFEYHAVIADKIEYRYVHRASICPASGMDRLEELDMALEQASGALTDFDELTVRQLVSNIKVLDKDSLLICFKDGTEITQAMQRRISA